MVSLYAKNVIMRLGLWPRKLWAFKSLICPFCPCRFRKILASTQG